MSEPLPSGTVTFLFTDIEGSTKRLLAVGDEAYVALLADEARLVLGAARDAGGVPFGSEGDAHFVAFASAADGVRGAVAAQQALATHAWPGGDPVRVRMGLHTGDAVVVGDDYAGFEVHRAARVAAAGHGGQVLVTEATRVLASDPGRSITLRDLGEHRLKDLARPERLYQVVAPGLDATFPALRTLDAMPNNLPPQLTSFVGRAELDAARSLLDRARLLTLTGPGGTGKTRLSLALAGDCVDRFPGGAWFVPLAAVTDPSLVASAIASSLGVLAPSHAPIDAVRDYLRDRHALLVLDNFEQVVDGAPVVADLLRTAGQLTVIVSSRAPLKVSGEQEFPVPPLSLPVPGERDPVRAMEAEAVRLFVDRAMAVRPDFALTAENAGAVTEIVRRLDGLPLAIELAAARSRLLSPAAMAKRLDDRLGLLAGGSRDAPDRQRTLRGAIAWSWDLLGPGDRRLFARLGAFAGGGGIERVEAVCSLSADAEPTDAVIGLERLAEQSLVRIGDDAHGDARFAMLETIREFALEQLEAAGEVAAVRAQHATAYQAFLEESGPEGPALDDRGDRLDRIEEEHDNVRAALDFLVATGDPAGAARMAHAAWRFWQMRGHLVEGRARVDAVLAMPHWDEAPPVARLRALEAAGGLAYWAADVPAAHRHYTEAAAVARALGDDAELATALYNLAFASSPDGLGTPSDEDAGVVTGRRHLDEAIALWMRLGDDRGLARGLWGLGEYHLYRGEYGESEESLTRGLEIFERLGDRFWIAWSRFTRAFCRTRTGRTPAASEDMAVALRVFIEDQDVSGVALVMAASTTLLLLGGRTRTAYETSAAVRRLVAETGIHLAGAPPVEGLPVTDLATADPALREAIDHGASLPRDDAAARLLLALDELAAGVEPGGAEASEGTRD